jgi:hypothetical protein
MGLKEHTHENSYLVFENKNSGRNYPPLATKRKCINTPISNTRLNKRQGMYNFFVHIISGIELMRFASQWPGSGDYFHFLHHAHFDCNYGSPHVPLDWFFGTYAGNKAEVRHQRQNS